MATITAGAYDADDHTVDLTVTGGPSGTLAIYRVRGTDLPRVVVSDVAYDGSSYAVTDRFAGGGTNTYHLYLDGSSVDTDTAVVTITKDWWISLDDPTLTRAVCIVMAGGDSVYSRRRRGWYGNVVGQDRVVGVTDVTMGGAERRLRLLASSVTEQRDLDYLLRKGTAALRFTEGAYSGPDFVMVLDYDLRPVGGGRDPHWEYTVNLVNFWPAGYLLTTGLP